MVSHEVGFNNLPGSSDIPQLFIQIAETSPWLSLRGTAFYVICLIQRLSKNQSLTQLCGWEPSQNTR